MSKYIIELNEDCKIVQQMCVTEHGNAYTDGCYSCDLEELNSDYINEHYGELQDEAYQKGFEEGKKYFANGCVGCQYEDDENRVIPCCECARVCDDHYIPKRSDRIEVGDEVEAPQGKAIVTAVKDDLVNYFYSGGGFGCVELYHVTKTGRHFDIASILEAMRT